MLLVIYWKQKKDKQKVRKESQVKSPFDNKSAIITIVWLFTISQQFISYYVEWCSVLFCERANIVIYASLRANWKKVKEEVKKTKKENSRAFLPLYT